MKKIAILFICTAALFFTACKKDLTTLNVDSKNPLNVPSKTLFTNAQRTISNVLTSSNVNLNIFRLIVQQWQETTYTDESNYDIVTRQVPDNVWDGLYRDVLRDFQQAKTLAATDITDAAILKNDTAVIDIMQVYTWYYLVTTFGNVPYSQALNINNAFPKYDDQKTVYYDLLTRLDADIAALNTSAESFGSADIIYNGDVAKWKKFANSLKLKMGMTIADSDAAKAKSVVESAAAAGVFTSNADNALFRYLASPPNTNPVWVDLVQSGRQDFVATSTFTNVLNNLNDPRRDNYFTFDGTGAAYSGGNPGASSNYATYSKPSGPLLISNSNGKVTNPDFPSDLLDYSEVEFLLAEGVARGFTITGTVQSHYDKAITASILYWDGTAAEATAYLLQPGVNYLTAPGTYKQKIGVQKWLALYNRGWDAWIEWRRLDYPQLTPAVDAVSVIPLRFTYPINEQNVNTANYNAASSAIGGDDVGTKLFWNIF
jgi:hypothetical protein